MTNAKFGRNKYGIGLGAIGANLVIAKAALENLLQLEILWHICLREKLTVLTNGLKRITDSGNKNALWGAF